MQCPDKLKVERRGHRVCIFRNLDKPEMLITNKSELLWETLASRKRVTEVFLLLRDKYAYAFGIILFPICILFLVIHKPRQ